MKKGRIAALFVSKTELLQVLADQASQFKHGDLGFAKDCLELVVSIDVALVHLVLQAVLLDVSPKLADHFRAGNGRLTDDCCQCCTRRHGFHKCRIGCALFCRRFLCGYFFGRAFLATTFLAATFFAGAAFLAATFFAGAAFFAGAFLAGAFFAVAMVDFLLEVCYCPAKNELC